MSSDDQREREVEDALARLAARAVPDAAPVPAPPWRGDAAPTRVRRFGRAAPWLVAAVLLVLAGLGAGAAVTFGADRSGSAPVGDRPTAPPTLRPSSTPTARTPVPATSSAPPSTSTSPSMSPDASVGTTTPGSVVPPGSSAGSTPTTPGLCTPTVMTFALTRTDGAAGSGYFSVLATNRSSSPCVTTGFPGLALLDASGRQILQADRDTSRAPTTVVVGPGQVVSSVVRVASTSRDGNVCPTSPAFLLTLPDNTDSTRIERLLPACSVTVGPFVAGSGA